MIKARKKYDHTFKERVFLTLYKIIPRICRNYQHLVFKSSTWYVLFKDFQPLQSQKHFSIIAIRSNYNLLNLYYTYVIKLLRIEHQRILYCVFDHLMLVNLQSTTC